MAAFAVRSTGTTPVSTVAGEWAGASPPAADHLARVEARLRAVGGAPRGRLAQLALHLVEAGGKRLRPMLVISAAVASGGHARVTPRVVDAAVVVELVHLASLYHDDVLDSAALRRARPTANALWGDRTAVLGGDVLLSHAYRVASTLGPGELRRISDTLIDLCAGQIAEGDARFDPERDVAQYEASIRGKTAALLATACWLGASTANASATARETLAGYGSELGMAFQVIDDLLDLQGGSWRLGKPIGSDLREGVYTLPVLLARAADTALDDLLVEGVGERDVAEVRDRVRAAGGDRRALAVALDHLHRALSLVEQGEFDPEGERLLTALVAALLKPVDRLEPAIVPGARNGDGNGAMPAGSSGSV